MTRSYARVVYLDDPDRDHDKVDGICLCKIKKKKKGTEKNEKIKSKANERKKIGNLRIYGYKIYAS